MKNVRLPHFRAIPAHSELFPRKNHDIPDFWDRSGLLSSKCGKLGNCGIISRFWGLSASLSVVSDAKHSSSTCRASAATCIVYSYRPKNNRVRGGQTHPLRPSCTPQGGLPVQLIICAMQFTKTHAQNVVRKRPVQKIM